MIEKRETSQYRKLWGAVSNSQDQFARYSVVVRALVV